MKDTIFAYVPRLTSEYGLGCPPVNGEDPFATWARLFQQSVGDNPEIAGLAEGDPADIVPMLIDQFDGVFILVTGGQASVFSLRRSNRLPEGFTSKVRQMVGVYPNDRVGWYRSVDAQPVPVLAAEVIYGMDAAEVATEKSRPRLRGVDPKNKGQVKSLRRRFWTGQTSPEQADDIVDILLSNQ